MVRGAANQQLHGKSTAGAATACLPTSYACRPAPLPRSDKDLGTETVLRLTEEEQEFVFEGVEVCGGWQVGLVRGDGGGH